jgi:hypothetical protein
MKTVAIISGYLIAFMASAASDSVDPARTIRSSSGQFIVNGAVLELPPSAPSATNQQLLELDPNLLAVSCERIKQVLLSELGVADLWRGRIHVGINSSMASNQPPVIGAKVFTDGWAYRLELPRQIERLKLVRGVTQVLLMEFANRNAGLRSAEIPLWLSEGLSQHLINSAETDLVLSQPRWTVNNINVNWLARRAVRRDPLKDARERLRTHAALSFSKLGDPAPDQLPEEPWKTYQSCSQLFVTQLAQLNGGRAALMQFLWLLPHHLNWQTAFLTAFKPQFPRLLDVEKWWAVVLVHFTGLDPMNSWSREVAVQKLDDVLRPPVLVAANSKVLPHRSRMTVQQIISDWDYLRQRIILRQTATQLLMMRFKTPVEMAALVDEYRATLDNYLTSHDQLGAARSLPGLPPTRADVLARDVVKKMNELDQRRALYGRPNTAGASTLAAPGK